LVGKKRNATTVFSVGGAAVEASVINVDDLMTANGENET
jgi:hypothetical protein